MKSLILELVRKVVVFTGIHHLFRQLNKDKILILLYHGVLTYTAPYSSCTQLPFEKFKWEIQYLKKYQHIMPLAEIVKKLRGKEALPRYAAAITFDDGFQNNYTAPYPFLKQSEPSATFFLATGNIETKDLLWPDRLFVTFCETDKEELDLETYGLGTFRFKTLRQKEHEYRIVLERMKKLPIEEKDRILKVITEILGKRGSESRYVDDFVLLSWQQVSEMHDSGLIQFGAQPEHHEILSRLDPEVVREEIANSCAAIRDRVRQATILFAYPNGSPDDFNETTKDILRQQKILCALSAIEALNAPDGDVYELKRIGVGSDTTRSRFVLQCTGFIPWFKSIVGKR